MTSPPGRVRAEAAFGHLQHAAREILAAAHDTLDMIDDVVSRADLAEILDTVDHLSRALLKIPGPWTATPRPAPRPAPGTGPEPDEAAEPARRSGTGGVQRISVR